jgi:hypothetical protein
VSQTEVPGLEVRADITSEAIIVCFTDELPVFQTEEVIRHLKSGGRADRTHGVLIDVIQVFSGVGTTIKVLVSKAVELFRCELAVRDALVEFFTSRRSAQCAV